MQSQLPGLKRCQTQLHQLTRVLVQPRKVEQPKIIPVPLMAGDPLVVVDQVTAAVQDQLAAIHLDRPRMVRRVSVHDVDTAVDQPVGEADLIGVDVVAPVGSPVHRHHDDVTGPAHLRRRRQSSIGRRSVRAATMLTPGRSRRGRPAVRNAAGRRAEGEDDDPSTARTTGTIAGAAASAQRPSRPGHAGYSDRRQHIEGLEQAASAEVEHVVVGQHADVGPDGAERRQRWLDSSGSGRPCRARTRRWW